MKKIVLFILLSSFLTIVWAGNVRITSNPYIDLETLKDATKTTIYMQIEWDNSWRDKHNWDAVYVFLKCKKSTDVSWSHVMLRDGFHKVSSGFTYFPAKDPNKGVDKTTGLFIHRAAPGEGKSVVSLELQWKFSANGLTKLDLLNGVSIEAMAIEMVYIPKGPFRPGDQYSKNCFQKEYRQIKPEWDLIKPGTSIYAGSWYNTNPAQMNPMEDDRGPEQVCAHNNDVRNAGYIGSIWISENPGHDFIIFDLQELKTVRYVAMEIYGNPVSTWEVSGSQQKRGTAFNWKTIGTFSGTLLPTAAPNQVYPARQAIPLPLDKIGPFRYYRFVLNMQNAAHYAHVRTISMTDKDLQELTDDAYIIDGAGNQIQFDQTLGLNAKEQTLSGSLSASYAVGFEGFYVMKYEISQRQYVDFLNKLTIDEQKLRTIGGELDNLTMGDYVYGSGNHKTPVCRNGIVVGALQDNSYAFACDLTRGGTNDKGYNEENDGLDIACNFLSPKDMLAYAAWSGLRPLSELEYEKMGHQTIDSLTGKVPVFPARGYAWGNINANFPGGNSIFSPGENKERLSSANVNAGGVVSGPVRVGSFSNGTSGVAQSSGASFYGVMELSGNLAEIYYRAEPGKTVLYQELISHGSGVLTGGEMPTALRTYWGNPDVGNGTYGQSLILRGGSFASSKTERTRFSDRGEENGYSNDLNRKDSTVTFRLGHSVTAYQIGAEYYPYTWIKNENDAVADEGVTVIDTVCTGNGYTIIGSDPVAEGMKPSGELRYIWYYMVENNGRWLMMEGKNGKDLRLTAADLDHNSRAYRTFSYKRRIYTPTQYSESGIVTLRVGTNSPFTRDKEECIQKNNQINGVLVESLPVATFKWYGRIGDKRKDLAPFYTTNYSSYMSVIRDSFPDAGSGELVCEVTTKELGCKKEVSVPFKVIARPSSGINSNTFSLNRCGSDVKDPRDGQFYTTVLIGEQCWMAENMRYVDETKMIPNNWVKYSPVDREGFTYGCEYYNLAENTDSVCPPGWKVPSVQDFNILYEFANNGGDDDYGGYRLKAGNFWMNARDDQARYHDYIYAKEWREDGKENPTGHQEGFNTLGFGLMGGGWQGGDPRTNPSYCEAWLMARRTDYPYQYMWRMGCSNRNFYNYHNNGYWAPVRCILKSTSVD